MKYGYIGKLNSAKEFHEYILLFEQREVPLDNVILNPSFAEFLASRTEGDTVIICSYIGLQV